MFITVLHGGVGLWSEQRFYLILGVCSPSLSCGWCNLRPSIAGIALQRLQEGSGTREEVGLLGVTHQDGNQDSSSRQLMVPSVLSFELSFDNVHEGPRTTPRIPASRAVPLAHGRQAIVADPGLALPSILCLDSL